MKKKNTALLAVSPFLSCEVVGVVAHDGNDANDGSDDKKVVGKPFV